MHRARARAPSTSSCQQEGGLRRPDPPTAQPGSSLSPAAAPPGRPLDLLATGTVLRPLSSRSALCSPALRRPAPHLCSRAARPSPSARPAAPPPPPESLRSQGDNWSLVMSEDIEIDDAAILPIGTGANDTQSNGDAQPCAPKRKLIRSCNYSQEEDLQLCKSWENISLHPITGNEQPSMAYWKRIHDNFHANKTFASNRNENSLEHRWGVIHKECQKFQGLFEEVEHRHPDGVPYEEHLLEAQNAYANNDPKKRFSFLHCWLKIRHSQKFTAPTTNKRRRGSNSPPTIDVFDLEDDESIKSQTPDSSMPNGKRPMDRKQAKKKLKKSGKQTNYARLLEKWLTEKEKIKEDRWQENKMMQERKISLEERKLSLEERKLANEEKKMLWEREQKIMFCDLHALEPSQKTYVIAMRAQIAAEKKAAFNSAFGGSSGGHEASGGHSSGG